MTGKDTVIDPDAPLRLDKAAALAFPDGTMTESGLRREKSRGRLVIERIAGKDYTTLNHIKEMRRLCQLQQKVQGSTSAQRDATSEASSHTAPSGSSATPAGLTKAQAAARTIVESLKENSRNTSAASTSRKRRKDNVVRVKFRSPTS